MTDLKIHKNISGVTLPDGSGSDNYSSVYMRYCEAKTIARWGLGQRRQFLAKLTDTKRIEELKYWLKIIWKNK